MTAAEPGGAAVGGASALLVAFAGLVSLAVAMGIGRFAFTPILPLMLRDGVVDIASAGWLASANYLGYLAGALFCTFQPWLAARITWLPASGDATRSIRAGLAATALLTLGMALPLAAAWPLLRFGAGVASAVTLVHTTGWCFAQLSARGRPAIGSLIFVGPGAGIIASGGVASGVVAAHGSAAVGWAVSALLATGLTALVWRVLGSANAAGIVLGGDAGSTPDAPLPSRHGRAELATLALAYGLAGFGYIVTATFLPVIARAALPGTPWIDLFWPVFGTGAVLGALLATRAVPATDRRHLLAGAYAIQAGGVFIGIAWPSIVGFTVGSFFAGLPFTTITFFALQETHRLRPRHAASAIGLVTAVYGIGQIAGPPMVSWLVAHSAQLAGGFNTSLEIAATVLLTGAMIYLAMTRLWPLRVVAQR
ncbi:MAG: YbfB/YjiJ family MFS transporter [Caldimonas sp.]